MNLKTLLPFSEKRTQTADASPFVSLQREIDRLFAEFTRGWPAFGGTDLMPRMDVLERDDHIEITAELPGLEQKDVEITLADDILTIRGEKRAEKEEKSDNRRIVERSYGTFSRAIELPAGIDPQAIKASMAKGVLKVSLPKPALPKTKAKKIEIQAAA